MTLPLEFLHLYNIYIQVCTKKEKKKKGKRITNSRTVYLRAVTLGDP